MAVDAQCRSSAGNEASARRSGDSRRPRTPDIAGPDAIESAQASYFQLPARAVLSRSRGRSHSMATICGPVSTLDRPRTSHPDSRDSGGWTFSTAISGRRQEPDAAHRATRVGQPPAHAQPPSRQRGLGWCVVTLHATAIRRTFVDDQHDAASRVFWSRRRSVASADVSSLLTSTTRSVEGASCQARMSIEPWSPKRAYDTSTRTSHRSARSLDAQVSESDAWRSSRSRSSSPPRQWTSTTTVASRAASTRRRRSNETSAERPRSISETVDRPTPASLARSARRQPRRRRKARTVAPMRSDRTPILCADPLHRGSAGGPPALTRSGRAGVSSRLAAVI